MTEPTSLSECRSCGRLHGEAEPCKKESLEQRAALTAQDILDGIADAATNKALAVGEAERQRLQAQVKALEALLAEGVSLLADFAGSYLSADGQEVFVRRGRLGKRLTDFWPKALATLSLTDAQAQAKREETR